MKARSVRLELVILVLILLIALVLRLWGIGFGLPYEYHIDEDQWVRQAVSIGERGPEPPQWNNPPFYKYVFFVEYGVLFLLGNLAGWYESVADFAGQSTLDPTVLHLLARGTTALLGALTVWLVYKLGRSAYNRRTGLLGAWFLAVCFLHVRDSHYAVNDIPATLFVTLSLLGATKIAKMGTLKWYAFTGAVLGLGFATKYSVAAAVVPALIAHFFSPQVSIKRVTGLKLSRLLVLLALLGMVAILASPYFVITPSKFIQGVYDYLYAPGKYGLFDWQIDPMGGHVFYIKSLIWGLGWGLALLCFLGLGAAILRHRPMDWILLSMPIIVYAYMGGQKMYFARFILPVIPALLVLGAAFLEHSIRSLIRNRATALCSIVAIALVVTLQPLVSSLRSDYLLTRDDTRDIAKMWIEANIPAGSKIALDWPVHSPSLSTEQRPLPNSSRTYNATAVRGPGLSNYPIERYREQGFDYVIATSFIYNSQLANDSENAQHIAFYHSLGREFSLVQTFWPNEEGVEPPFIFDELYGPAIGLWQRDRPGPVLKIYQVQP